MGRSDEKPIMQKSTRKDLIKNKDLKVVRENSRSRNSRLPKEKQPSVLSSDELEKAIKTGETVQSMNSIEFKDTNDLQIGEDTKS